MAERILKGLTKQFIKECKDPELNFSKKELKAIKKTARVVLYGSNKSSWYLVVGASLDEDPWRVPHIHGEFTWNKKEAKGDMRICSGQCNTVSYIDRRYDCTRPQGTTYQEEFNTLIEFMKKARKAQAGLADSYREYVIKTGDMS
jgi:hypothetical protein